MKRHNVTVLLINGRHVCQPSPIEVNGGDEVHWGSRGVPIFFAKSPFEEGTGSFEPGSNSTIKRGLKKGDRFSGVVKTGEEDSPVEGDIIVIDPG